MYSWDAIEIFGILANETRFAALSALANSSRAGLTLTQLVDRTSTSRRTVRRQLDKLEEAGLISCHMDRGRLVFVADGKRLESFVAFVSRRLGASHAVTAVPARYADTGLRNGNVVALRPRAALPPPGRARRTTRLSERLEAIGGNGHAAPPGGSAIRNAGAAAAERTARLSAVNAPAVGPFVVAKAAAARSTGAQATTARTTVPGPVPTVPVKAAEGVRAADAVPAAVEAALASEPSRPAVTYFTETRTVNEDADTGVALMWLTDTNNAGTQFAEPESDLVDDVLGHDAYDGVPALTGAPLDPMEDPDADDLDGDEFDDAEFDDAELDDEELDATSNVGMISRATRNRGRSNGRRAGQRPTLAEALAELRSGPPAL